VDGFLGGGGVDQVQLLRGQGRPAEMGQDVVVKGKVGPAGINEDPIAVINDDGRFSVFGFRFSDFPYFSYGDRFHLFGSGACAWILSKPAQATRFETPDSDLAKEIELAGQINQFLPL
jgi:hypothetical protein